MDNKPYGVDAKDLSRFKIYIWTAFLVWTVIVGLSLGWNVFNTNQQTLQLVEKEARSNFDKDQAFRFWASAHGGVYVPVNERTPANPYLSHIEERDIVTPSGRQLTLMNPAYMLRQMMEEYGELYGVKGRIISEKPLNLKKVVLGTYYLSLDN